jgi:hypothetical protein
LRNKIKKKNSINKKKTFYKILFLIVLVVVFFCLQDFFKQREVLLLILFLLLHLLLIEKLIESALIESIDEHDKESVVLKERVIDADDDEANSILDKFGESLFFEMQQLLNKQLAESSFIVESKSLDVRIKLFLLKESLFFFHKL